MLLTPRFDYELTPRGRTHKVIFHLTLQAPKAEPAGKAERSPVNLSLVLDRSGSMSGAKLQYTKDAARLVVDHLTERDTLSVVMYDDSVDTIVPPRPVTNKDAIKARINEVFSRGCTNLSGGYQRGDKLVRETAKPGQINRVLLLTDGIANVGVTEPPQLVALARQFKDAGVSTTTLGFGADFREELLKEMADAGGGNFFYIENPDQAPAVFREELGEVLALVAQDLTLTIEWAPGVSLAQLINDYPKETLVAPSPETGGGKIRLRLNDAFGGEEKIVIGELDLPAMHEVGEMPVAAVTLEYLRLQPSPSRETMHLAVTKKVVEPAACENQERSGKVVEDAMLLRIARAQVVARLQAENGDVAGASKTLLTITNDVQLSPTLSEKFKDEVQELQQTQNAMENDGYNPTVAKRLMSNSYNQQRRKGKYK